MFPFSWLECRYFWSVTPSESKFSPKIGILQSQSVFGYQLIFCRDWRIRVKYNDGPRFRAKQIHGSCHLSAFIPCWSLK